MPKLRILFVVALSAAVVDCAPMGAEQPRTVQMHVALTAVQEVPPVPPGATGQGMVTFDRATRRVSWSVAYGGLSGPVQAAHFHGPAAPGLNAGVAVPMPVTFSPMVGSAILIDAMAADLLGGRMYINLHTPVFPNGEIRGQVA